MTSGDHVCREGCGVEWSGRCSADAGAASAESVASGLDPSELRVTLGPRPRVRNVELMLSEL